MKCAASKVNSVESFHLGMREIDEREQAGALDTEFSCRRPLYLAFTLAILLQSGISSFELLKLLLIVLHFSQINRLGKLESMSEYRRNCYGPIGYGCYRNSGHHHD